MPTYDLIMLLVLVSATIFGAIKGFAWQVASLASILASYFVAYYFRNDVAKVINAEHPWNLFLAMLVLYGGTSFFIWMIFRLVSSAIDKVRLKEFDRHMGALFGFGKGVAYCLLITMFAMTLLGADKQRAICSSRSGYYMSKILAGADGLLPKEVEQIIGPHLDSLEKKLEDGREGQYVGFTPQGNGNGQSGFADWDPRSTSGATSGGTSGVSGSLLNEGMRIGQELSQQFGQGLGQGGTQSTPNQGSLLPTFSNSQQGNGAVPPTPGSGMFFNREGR